MKVQIVKYVASQGHVNAVPHVHYAYRLLWKDGIVGSHETVITEDLDLTKDALAEYVFYRLTNDGRQELSLPEIFDEMREIGSVKYGTLRGHDRAVPETQ